MRIGIKSYLLRCLESDLLDGAAVVQVLNPRTARTLKEYGEHVFAPYIYAQLENSSRVDLV